VGVRVGDQQRVPTGFEAGGLRGERLAKKLFPGDMLSVKKWISFASDAELFRPVRDRFTRRAS
jgi:hypothetical protein